MAVVVGVIGVVGTTVGPDTDIPKTAVVMKLLPIGTSCNVFSPIKLWSEMLNALALPQLYSITVSKV